MSNGYSRRDAFKLVGKAAAVYAAAKYLPSDIERTGLARLEPDVAAHRFRNGPFSHGARTSWFSDESFGITLRACPTKNIPKTQMRVRLYVDAPNGGQVGDDIILTASSSDDFWTQHTFTGLKSFQRYRYEVDFDGPGNKLVGYTHSPQVRALDPITRKERDFERYAFVCCMNYGEGFWDVLDHLRRMQPDLVFLMGDLIYERQGGKSSVRPDIMPDADEDEALFLMRQWVYNDIFKRKLLLEFPCIFLPDDHEFANDYGIHGDVRAYKAGSRTFSKVYPCMADSLTNGYRRQLTTPMGTRFIVLDVRSSREEETNNRPASILGREQKAWFFDQLRQAAADNVQNLIIVSSVWFVAGNEASRDSWAGFPEERQEAVDMIVKCGLKNVTIMTGDIHELVESAIHEDLNDMTSPVVARELTVGAASSKPHDRNDFSDAAEVVGRGFNGVTTLDIRQLEDKTFEKTCSWWQYRARNKHYRPSNRARFVMPDQSHGKSPQIHAQLLDPVYVQNPGGILVSR